MLVPLSAFSSVQARTRIARYVFAFAILPGVADVTSTRIASMRVETFPVDAGLKNAFILVVFTPGTGKARSAPTFIRIAHRSAFSAIAARLRSTMIFFFAMFACISWRARTLILLE